MSIESCELSDELLIMHTTEVYIFLVQYRKSDIEIYPFDFIDFLKDYNTPIDGKFVTEFLDNRQYKDALRLYGKLEYDECFGYVPLLALGGSEKAKNLQKMKIIPHIDLITDMA